MNYNYVKYTLVTLSTFFLSMILGCKEDIGTTPAREGAKPGPVTNVSFTSIPGGAIIKYDLPSSEDLRYVRATYTLANGRQRVEKASIFDNKIKVNGFANAGEHKIELATVAVGEVESDPVSITVTAATPKYKELADEFKSEERLYATFGGFNAFFDNPDGENFIITIVKSNSFTNNIWVGVDTIYTNDVEGVIRLRGEEAIESTYGILVQDQWGNYSDTIRRTLTPIEEVMLPKDELRLYPMVAYSTNNTNGDFTRNSSHSAAAEMQISLWDGSATNRNKHWWGKGSPIPFSFTIDLKYQVKLSRLKMWPRVDNNNLIFQATHIKEFEVYGSNSPNPNGDWSAWELITTFQSRRPSGLPFGVNPTAEDIAYALAGEDFEFGESIADQTYRYLRIKVLCSWNGFRDLPLENPYTTAIGELELYGQITD